MGDERGESGQSTVEFALVAIVVLAVSVGLAALTHLAADGTLLAHAAAEASHAAGQPNVGVVGDVVFF